MGVKVKKLTANQKIFADEWLIDRNGTRACRVAYPSIKSDEVAVAAASRLLRNVKVAVYIDKRLESMANKSEITAERVLLEYKRLAFLDPGTMLEKDGTMLDMTDMPEDARRCIGGIEVYTEIGEDGVSVGSVKKVKLISKTAALNDLAKHLGLFEKDNNQRRREVVLNINRNKKNG